ncbi:hypothetical protein C8J57DRAFT_9 [Mycena rebaudengoi]|nr:hypothetical protein C8J57DRAFT_9 [Mycena rebaudengoi]
MSPPGTGTPPSRLHVAVPLTAVTPSSCPTPLALLSIELAHHRIPLRARLVLALGRRASLPQPAARSPRRPPLCSSSDSPQRHSAAAHTPVPAEMRAMIPTPFASIPCPHYAHGGPALQQSGCSGCSAPCCPRRLLLPRHRRHCSACPAPATLRTAPGESPSRSTTTTTADHCNELQATRHSHPARLCHIYDIHHRAPWTPLLLGFTVCHLPRITHTRAMCRAPASTQHPAPPPSIPRAPYAPRSQIWRVDLPMCHAHGRPSPPIRRTSTPQRLAPRPVV